MSKLTCGICRQIVVWEGPRPIKCYKCHSAIPPKPSNWREVIFLLVLIIAIISVLYIFVTSQTKFKEQPKEEVISERVNLDPKVDELNNESTSVAQSPSITSIPNSTSPESSNSQSINNSLENSTPPTTPTLVTPKNIPPSTGEVGVPTSTPTTSPEFSLNTPATSSAGFASIDSPTRYPSLHKSPQPTEHLAPLASQPSSTSNTTPYAPSFDCLKASSPVDHQVCEDRELSNLDLQMSQLYKTARARTQDKEQLRAEQIGWIKSKRACANKTCIEKAYQDRIKQLSN